MQRRRTERHQRVGRRIGVAPLGLTLALALVSRAEAGPGLIVASSTGAGVPIQVSGSFLAGDVAAAVTPDGRFVAFCGNALASATLGVPDTNGTPELYVRDMQTGALSLVTYNAAGTAAAGGCQGPPSISDDGRFVAFASDLPAGSYVNGVIDASGQRDVFVRDRQLNVTRLASISFDGTQSATGAAGGPVISPNGRYVAFTSVATSLVSGFVNTNGAAADLFVRNLETNVTSLVSAASASAATGHNGASVVLLNTPRVFSQDGRYLLFASDASNLVAGAFQLQLYRRDLEGAVTALVSARTGTSSTVGGSLDPAVVSFSASADGRFVALLARATNLAAIATDPLVRQVFLRDTSTNQTTLVSVNPAGTAAGNASAESALISRNGLVVAFSSQATNLVTGLSYPAGARTYAFARTLASATTAVVSVTPFGTLANGDTHVRDIGASGRHVALHTFASDLSTTLDANFAGDIAVRDLVAGTTVLASTIPSGALTGNQGAMPPAWVNDLGQATFASQSSDLVAGASGNLVYGIGANRATFTLSGTVQRNGEPLPGVTLTLSGTTTATAQTNLGGSFTFSGLPAGGTYTVTPVLAGYTFTPPSATVANLQANTAVTFTAVRPAIRGTVTLLGAGVPGVTMALSGSASAVATTSAGGTYEFADLPAGGSFTVTPALPGLTFTPAFRSIANLTADQAADFTATCVGAITGVVRDRLDAPVPGVTMTLSPAGLTTTTGNDGGYAFSGVPLGQTLTITPSLPGFTFVPASQQVTTAACLTMAPVTFRTSSALYTRYFAEGATGSFFDTSIALLNPTPTATTARLTFHTSTGGRFVHDVPMAAMSRATVNPELVAGLEDAEFCTSIVSGQPVVADRTMRWDARGYGSHAETSVAQARTSWYLAEGATIGGFDLFYLLQNASDQVARVTVKYLLPAPAAPIEKTYTVQPRGRTTVWVNTEDGALASAEVSAVVTSNVPVIVERAMYRGVGDQVFGAGHAGAAVAGPAAAWFFAEGATGDYFDLFYLIANPGELPARVEGRYLLPDGSVLVKAYDVAPRSRFTVWADIETFDGHAGHPLGDTAVSATFTSTNGVPVVVERAMWWPGGPAGWHEGHNSAGALAAGTQWALAEGEVGGPANAQTYVLIANTSAFDGLVEVKLVFEDGTTSAALVRVKAHSRANFDVEREMPATRGRRFGTIVESLGGTPAQIVVERAMYSDAGGVPWAAGTNSLATRLR